MELKKLEHEKFLYCGQFKTKLFKQERTSLLLDSDLLWIRGYNKENHKYRRKLDNFQMKYSDILSIEIVANKTFDTDTIRIMGKLYKLDQPIIIHIPYLENAENAISHIRESIDVCTYNNNERCKELENIRHQRAIHNSHSKIE